MQKKRVWWVVKMKSKNNVKKNNKPIDYIIIGNSAAGLAAAESIRELDRTGEIMILTGENYLNYSKPMITYFLTGSVNLDKIHFKEEKLKIILKKMILKIYPYWAGV